mmetsp:Transcript_39349/g.87569  ORF Transcript_39349/g.87569 Transcript_39349/m.87569 type:complete len:100 (-) Transcript_39349:349-648(-)
MARHQGSVRLGPAWFSDEDQQPAVLVYAVPPDEYLQGYLQQPWLTVGKKVMTNVPKELARMPQMVHKMPPDDVDSRGSSGQQGQQQGWKLITGVIAHLL